MRIILTALAMMASATAAPAIAQDASTVILVVDKVHSATGKVTAGLCSNPAAQFPGYCGEHYQSVPAANGAVTITFPNVKPGDYAIQIFHDENGDDTPQIPPEGYAYGNNAPFPPSFKAAAVKVEGPTTRTSANMLYLQDQMPAARQGSKGAAAEAGVNKTDVRENGLYAEFYAPQSDKKLPALIVFGGSEGGLDSASRMASSFTRRGYAVMAVAYFAELGLPPTLEGVPVEYFDKALAWLRARPEIDATRIGAIGGSRGSEVALLLASHSKDIKAVLAFAPSGVMWQGLGNSATASGAAWTASGKSLPFATPDATKYDPQGYVKMFESALAKGVDPASVIEVEKIGGPVMLLSGEADALWPSTAMANAVVERLKAKGFKHPVQHFSYPGAGHLVFGGDPTGRTPTAGGGGLALGGTAEANGKAWADNWPKAVKFFDDALKGPR